MKVAPRCTVPVSTPAFPRIRPVRRSKEGAREVAYRIWISAFALPFRDAIERALCHEQFSCAHAPLEIPVRQRW